MKTIAITGGKGGTGKSTFSVLFALELAAKGKKVVLCDCDVECPNDYLLLGIKKLKHFKKNIYANFPQIDKEKCRKCGLCVKACRNNALFLGKDLVFLKDLCSGCGACWVVCPFNAIKKRKEIVAKIYTEKIGNLTLITSVARPGLEETGPVVLKTKKFALDIKADYFLFDTAAGIHCPVVSALIDCDSAYVVTEPTPMGKHDLDLILDLCKQLEVPTKIVLNKADLGDRKIITRPINIEIPYSKELAKGELSLLPNQFYNKFFI